MNDILLVQASTLMNQHHHADDNIENVHPLTTFRPLAVVQADTSIFRGRLQTACRHPEFQGSCGGMGSARAYLRSGLDSIFVMLISRMANAESARYKPPDLKCSIETIISRWTSSGKLAMNRLAVVAHILSPSMASTLHRCPTL